MSTENEIIECEVVDNQLEKVIRDRGLTQEKTAKRARMTTRQLCRIMQQQNCPSLKRAKALSIVLDTPIDQLFKFKVKTRKSVEEVAKAASARKDARSAA